MCGAALFGISHVKIETHISSKKITSLFSILVRNWIQIVHISLKTTMMELLDTASIGTVYRKSMDTDFDSILKIADTEMYKQKKKYYKNIR